MTRTIAAFPRQFANRLLRYDGESPKFKQAVIAYVEAETYIHNNIGNADYHLAQAQKQADKLGVPEDERIKASDLAKVIYEHFLENPSFRPKRPKPPKTTIALDLSGLNLEELVGYSSVALSKNEPLKNNTSDWNLFEGYVLRLLKGETIPMQEFIGVPPSEVEKRAKGLLKNYRLILSKRRKDERMSRMYPSSAFGIDPQRYEEGSDEPYVYRRK